MADKEKYIEVLSKAVKNSERIQRKHSNKYQFGMC